MSRRAARLALGLLLGLIWGTLGTTRGITNWLRQRALLQPAILFGVLLLALLSLALPVRRRALLAVLGMASVIFAGAWLLMRSPEERVHLIEYGIVAVLFEAVFRERRLLKAFLATIAAGWFDECLQALIPSRHYDLRDVGFNALAGFFGLLLLSAYRALATDPQVMDVREAPFD